MWAGEVPRGGVGSGTDLSRAQTIVSGGRPGLESKGAEKGSVRASKVVNKWGPTLGGKTPGSRPKERAAWGHAVWAEP